MSKIEWTDETWDPIVGCSKVSDGCKNCHALRQAHRLSHIGSTREKCQGLTTPDGKQWTGKVRLDEASLKKPLHWRKPRRIFVNSMGDLFHESLHYGEISRVVEAMSYAPQHTYMVLTKRPHIAMDYFEKINSLKAYSFGVKQKKAVRLQETLKKIWLGVSVEDQRTANLRIPYLMSTLSAVKVISCEPLTAPLDLTDVRMQYEPISYTTIDALSGNGAIIYDTNHPDYNPTTATDGKLKFEHVCEFGGSTIDWVIAGGENGPGARPMHPDWIRQIRDQCQEANVPFFFKGWGSASGIKGRELDGRTWEEFPEVKQ